MWAVFDYWSVRLNVRADDVQSLNVIQSSEMHMEMILIDMKQEGFFFKEKTLIKIHTYEIICVRNRFN